MLIDGVAVRRSLESGHIALLEQSDDSLTSVLQVLHQLHEAATDRKQVRGRCTGLVQHLPGCELDLVDGFMHQFEVVQGEVREQDEVANPAIPALIGAAPGGFDISGLQFVAPRHRGREPAHPFDPRRTRFRERRSIVSGGVILWGLSELCQASIDRNGPRGQAEASALCTSLK